MKRHDTSLLDREAVFHSYRVSLGGSCPIHYSTYSVEDAKPSKGFSWPVFC